MRCILGWIEWGTSSVSTPARVICSCKGSRAQGTPWREALFAGGGHHLCRASATKVVATPKDHLKWPAHTDGHPSPSAKVGLVFSGEAAGEGGLILHMHGSMGMRSHPPRSIPIRCWGSGSIYRCWESGPIDRLDSCQFPIGWEFTTVTTVTVTATTIQRRWGKADYYLRPWGCCKFHGYRGRISWGCS